MVIIVQQGSVHTCTILYVARVMERYSAALIVRVGIHCMYTFMFSTCTLLTHTQPEFIILNPHSRRHQCM